MHSLGCHDISAYLLELDRSDKLRHECELLMTVSISRFFRDRKLWEVLEAEILPGLIEKRVKKIRVWSAGCASGEEVYSLKEVSEGFRSVYFNAQAGTKLYNIRTLMKSGVIWQLGHLLSDQPACFPSPFLF